MGAAGQRQVCKNQYEHHFPSPWQVPLLTKAPKCELPTTFQLTQCLLCNVTLAAAIHLTQI